MANPPGAVASVFVGRTHEQERVRGVLDAAGAGQMSALLLSGDTGVGKTLLVDRVCEEVAAGGDLAVLRGVCLSMSATTVPLMPLRTALRRLPPGVRPPGLGPADTASGPDGAVLLLDEWLERACADRPVVLVVDDVHWADEASLDVLTYVLAGPADRRLAVLLTLRRGEVGAGHPVMRWLADVRRMPCLTELSLGAFDRSETREQLQALLRTSPFESLVTEVQERTGGNAYLNRLLVEDLPPGSQHLPPGLPDDIRTAVLRPWQRLSAPARELVLAVAVGGEVATGPALDRAADLAGSDPLRVPHLLREAVDVGVLDVDQEGGYWFHHPLQAEALQAFLAGDDRRRMHTALARSSEAALATESAPQSAELLTRMSAVAEHHRLAGNLDSAYDWTARAHQVAAELSDGQAQLALLRRLVELHAQVGEAPEPRGDLLARLKQVAAALGEHEVEHSAVEELLEITSEEDDPLLVAELLVRREHLRFSTGRGFFRVEPVIAAAELSRPWPQAWQHGYALAEVAHASLWADTPDAQDAVAAAVRCAEGTGHPTVVAYAFAAAAMGAVLGGHPGGADLGARGAEAAVVARDWWAFVHATLWEANASAPNDSPLWVNRVRARREQLADHRGPHPYLAWLAVDEAGACFQGGDWRSATALLRLALGSDPGVAADVQARLLAAQLATSQGRQHEAEDHLARAEELAADSTAFLAWDFDAVRTLVRIGAGDARAAYEAAMVGILSPGVAPTLCEWLCPLAARALADLVATERERGAQAVRELGLLDELLGRFPHVIPDGDPDQEGYRQRLEALDALYAAEVARARRVTDEPHLWRRAADLLDGVFPWDAAYAAFRAGEAVLVHGGSREDAGSLLRRARRIALDLGAEPVLREVGALAAAARIRLDDVQQVSDRAGSELPGLTAREREILAHLVVGRTYGEIARALFVSEKTVSSHVSNLLRKTGSANRVELAMRATHAAARAGGQGAAPPTGSRWNPVP